MPRVLVVDDDATVLETSRLVLGRAGHEVTVADRGAAALSALRARPFDLVLADYQLPDFSGLDLLRLVRSDTNPVPFVVITGFGPGRASERQDLRHAGVPEVFSCAGAKTTGGGPARRGREERAR